jgi:hypothetical protein
MGALSGGRRLRVAFLAACQYGRAKPRLGRLPPPLADHLGQGKARHLARPLPLAARAMLVRSSQIAHTLVDGLPRLGGADPPAVRWCRTCRCSKLEAERALRIFKRLRIPDVIGTPTMAEACGRVVLPDRGGALRLLRPRDQRRMIQEFFLLIPKKNSQVEQWRRAMMVTARSSIAGPRPSSLLDRADDGSREHRVQAGARDDQARSELDKLFQVQNHLRRRSRTGSRGPRCRSRRPTPTSSPAQSGPAPWSTRPTSSRRRRRPRTSSSSSAAP